MTKVDERLAQSLSAETTELIPFLPYLLQDLWELGSSPKDISNLISKHINVNKNTRILDLACGKGAVSIHLAHVFGCYVKGIDIMPEFIHDAKSKSKDHHVDHLCDFMVEDINRSIEVEKEYDIVIFGAVGQVLGNQANTLKKLNHVVKHKGYVLLDDGYAKEQTSETYLTKNQWREIIEASGYHLIDELTVNESDFSEILNHQMDCISNRAKELKSGYPSQSHLFDQYIKSQLAECDDLLNDVEGVTILLRKIR